MIMPGWKEISDFVLKYDYCCGCGVCAGVCPQDALEMQFNEYGEYKPDLTGHCTDCGLCSKVCPFVNGNPNEDDIGKVKFGKVPGIKHTPETGYYLGTYVGHVADPEARWNSASGGLATWLLQQLLAEGEVDRVLCVSPNPDSDRLFKYIVCSNPQDVGKCGRSCYYPVTANEVLSFVGQDAGRYAITGLPCVCKAIRLAQQQSLELSRRIKYVIGLVCGQTKSKYFVEYCSALGGGDPNRLRRVQFRVKDTSRTASDFGLRFACGDDGGSGQEGIVYWTQGMGQAWQDRYFTPNACGFCDDVFAECADVVFMDAWLPAYSRDPCGHSMVLTRDARIDTFLTREAGHPVETFLRRLNVELVVGSQAGVLQVKRGGLRDRIAAARDDGAWVPAKRLRTAKCVRQLGASGLHNARHTISRQSKRLWAEVGKELDSFESRMRFFREAKDMAERHQRFYRIPNAILRRVNCRLI